MPGPVLKEPLAACGADERGGLRESSLGIERKRPRASVGVGGQENRLEMLTLVLRNAGVRERADRRMRCDRAREYRSAAPVQPTDETTR